MFHLRASVPHLWLSPLLADIVISYIRDRGPDFVAGNGMDVLKPSKLPEDDSVSAEPKPPIWMVLGLLVAAAGTFSYMGAFAVTDALVKVSVIRPISKNPDPRPLWAGIGFVAILTSFLVVGILMRHFSSRELRCIDRMNDGD